MLTLPIVKEYLKKKKDSYLKKSVVDFYPISDVLEGLVLLNYIAQLAEEPAFLRTYNKNDAWAYDAEVLYKNILSHNSLNGPLIPNKRYWLLPQGLKVTGIQKDTDGADIVKDVDDLKYRVLDIAVFKQQVGETVDRFLEKIDHNPITQLLLLGHFNKKAPVEFEVNFGSDD